MNYLWAPWRSTYVNGKRIPDRCVFCAAASTPERDAENLVVHRGRLSFVILNRYPYTSGHVMIAPFEHVSRLHLVDEETAGEMMRLTRFCERLIEGIYRPDGLNLGMNLGEAAGAGIEQHIHMHLLPRWRGDINFMTSVGDTRVLSEALEDTYARVRQGFAASAA
jgi:ATP adenylyltransferase